MYYETVPISHSSISLPKCPSFFFHCTYPLFPPSLPPQFLLFSPPSSSNSLPPLRPSLHPSPFLPLPLPPLRTSLPPPSPPSLPPSPDIVLEPIPPRSAPSSSSVRDVNPRYRDLILRPPPLPPMEKGANRAEVSSLPLLLPSLPPSLIHSLTCI